MEEPKARRAALERIILKARNYKHHAPPEYFQSESQPRYFQLALTVADIV